MAGENNLEVCTVDKILGKRKLPSNKYEYLVRWKEYPNEDTWEPLYNLKNV